MLFHHRTTTHNKLPKQSIRMSGGQRCIKGKNGLIHHSLQRTGNPVSRASIPATRQIGMPGWLRRRSKSKRRFKIKETGIGRHRSDVRFQAEAKPCRTRRRSTERPALPRRCEFLCGFSQLGCYRLKMATDGELLRHYIQDGAEDSFGELLQRHVNLVYSAALRQVQGDVHLAQDVAQCVFSDLARKARSLQTRDNLAGWLYT